MACPTCNAAVKKPAITGLYCIPCFAKEAATDDEQLKSAERVAIFAGAAAFVLTGGPAAFIAFWFTAF